MVTACTLKSFRVKNVLILVFPVDTVRGCGRELVCLRAVQQAPAMRVPERCSAAGIGFGTGTGLWNALNSLHLKSFSQKCPQW